MNAFRLFLITLLMMLFASPSFAQQGATPVFVTDVVQHDFVDEIEALGTLQANENVDLTSSVTERITRIAFESGQRVKQGDVLVEMDAAEEKALLTEEQSVVNEATRQVARLKPLIDRGATSQSTMDEAELGLQTARARIAAIQSQVSERHIVAPFDGKLGLRNVSVGELAQPGTLITTIDDDSIMKLDFSVPEVYLPAIKEGSQVTATAKAFADEIFAGTVESIDSRVDPITRSISVRALLDNADYRLRPGMLMRVKLQKNPRRTIVIPEEALVPKGDKNYVYVITGDQAAPSVSMTAVTLGSRRKGEVEILSGIKEGAKIVTHGTLRLQDGASVMIKAQDQNNPSLDQMLKQNDASDGE